MKIAVQMYGHLRTFELCFPPLKKRLLDCYDCDIFIHTWDKVEHQDKNYYSNAISPDDIAVNESIRKKIIQYYNPKAIKIETQDMFSPEIEEKKPGRKMRISRLNMKYMTYSMYQSNLLRKRYQLKLGVNYDFALVISFDIFLYGRLDFNKFTNEFKFHNRKSIHFGRVLKCSLSSNRYIIFPLLIDRFYFSTPSVINDISKLYLEFDDFYKCIDLVLPPKMKFNETIFYEYLLLKNINPTIRQFYYAVKRKDSRYDLLSFYHNPFLVKMSEDFFYKKKRIGLFFKLLDKYGDLIPKFLISMYRKLLYILKGIDTYMRIKKGI